MNGTSLPRIQALMKSSRCRCSSRSCYRSFSESQLMKFLSLFWELRKTLQDAYVSRLEICEFPSDSVISFFGFGAQCRLNLGSSKSSCSFWYLQAMDLAWTHCWLQMLGADTWGWLQSIACSFFWACGSTLQSLRFCFLCAVGFVWKYLGAPLLLIHPIRLYLNSQSTFIYLVLAGKQAVFQGSQMQGSQKDEGRFLFDEIVS